jgi:hypothetical protein
MNTSFEYRGYVVSHDGNAYTAAPVDEEPCQLRSKNLLRVTRAIDTLWNVLSGTVTMPSWFFLAEDILDLDAASEAMRIVDRLTSFPVVPLVVPGTAVA